MLEKLRERAAYRMERERAYRKAAIGEVGRGQLWELYNEACEDERSAVAALLAKR